MPKRLNQDGSDISAIVALGFVVPLLVAVECRAMACQHRYAKVVFDRQGAYDENERHAGDVANLYALHAYEGEQEIEQSTGCAGERIELLAEYERNFIDAYVTQNAAEDGRHDAKDDRAPRMISENNCFVQPNHHEERDRDGVEYEPCNLPADEFPSEQAYRNDSQRRCREIKRIGHPERLDTRQDVAKSSAPYSRYETNNARSEPIETLHARKPNSGNGARKSAEKFKYANEDLYFVRKV